MNPSTRAALGAAFALALAAAPAAAQEHHGGAPGEHRSTDADLSDPASVLRLLSVHQMRHLQQHGEYAASLEALDFPALEGVRVTIVPRGGEGFSAVAASGDRECAVRYGTAPPPRVWVEPAARVVCAPARDAEDAPDAGR